MEVASPSGASGYRELGQAQFGGQILITLRISASALKDFRLFWRGESEYCSGGSIDVRLEQLAMVRSVSLIVLCIFAKRFVLSVSGFLSQRNFCTTAVLLWGTHWGAVSWIVLFFSCRAIPRARLWARFSLQMRRLSSRVLLSGETPER